jgi:putative ABC transport system permease protein
MESVRYLRALYRTRRRGDALDREMHDEMRFHLDMEAERLVREQGLPPDEARRRAHVVFGGIEKHKEAGRETRPLHWIDALSFDARLGMRMLARYRGLTLTGGLAVAVAIAIGSIGFEVLSEMLASRLPFDPDARIVSIQVASSEGGAERKVLHELEELREQLVSIDHVGAFRSVQHNLVSPGRAPVPIKVAEMSASGFALAGIHALRGRFLVPDDERSGGPSVVVIGHDVWQSHFAADPDLVGRNIMLGGTPSIVVGIMPEGFRFPYDHEFWIPLRANAQQYRVRQGPSLYLFGRLAAGASMAQAQAELTTVDERIAAAHPDTHNGLRLRVLPYPREHVDLSQPALVWMLRGAQLLLGVLAFVVALNIAILLYARTITRLGELAVRTALGATRARILAQLFMEALALSLLGALAGLGLADAALDQVQMIATANGGVPFWIRFELSPTTVVYAMALALCGAAIMGVLPGLRATGRRVATNLQELNGRTAAKLGPVWTTLVVAQVAIAVAVLPVAAYLTWQVVRMEIGGPGFAADQYVVGTVVVSDEDASAIDASLLRQRHTALMSRLEGVPGVSAVTFSSAVPGFSGSRQFALEQDGLAAGGTFEANDMDVSIDFLTTYEAEIIAGRSLDARDLGTANNVVVNETFAQSFLRGRSPLGARVRRLDISGAEVSELSPSFEIVGVVRDFPSFPPSLSEDGAPVMYHAAAPGELHPFVLSAKFAGGIPAGIADRMRSVGADVDPALQLRRVVPLSQFYADVRFFWRYLAWAVTLVTISVLLLSAAGIYAMMSFIVAQRTREIGIRMALGARPQRIVCGVFARAAGQLGLGVLIGAALSVAVVGMVNVAMATAVTLVAGVAGVMVVVGLLATLGPARRTLRISSSDALRA